MTDKMIDKKADKIKELEREAAELAKQIDKIKDELRAELDARKVESVNTGIYNVIYNCYEQRRVDTDKLRKAGLYNKYSTAKTFTRLSINPVKALK